MEDRQIRIALQVFLSLGVLTIILFTGEGLIFVVGLIIANGLAFAFLPVSNFVSSVISSLIYGPAGQDDSYEYRFYQADMDQAKKMVREAKWDEAISAYRKIIEKAPEKVEARFELAKICEIAGYPGLALLEYQQIKESGRESGEKHPFVLESERKIEELKSRISSDKLHPPEGIC